MTHVTKPTAVTRKGRAAWSFSAGKVPRTAMPVPVPEGLARDGVGGVCGCGGPWREAARASVLYDGGPMTVVTRRCNRCAGEKTLYFRIAGAEVPADD